MTRSRLGTATVRRVARLRLPGRWAAPRLRGTTAREAPPSELDLQPAGGNRFVSDILVGFTNTREFGGALALAGRIADLNQARLMVVAATDAPLGMWLSLESTVERLALEEIVASELREALQELPRDVGVSSVVVDVGLAGALYRAISADPYDLIVLPAKVARKRAIRRVLASSAIPVRVAFASDTCGTATVVPEG
jgi:hypothetical protein